jgi:hypothetical protein
MRPVAMDRVIARYQMHLTHRRIVERGANSMIVYVVTMVDARGIGLDMPVGCLTREEAENKVARYAAKHPTYRFTIREESVTL